MYSFEWNVRFDHAELARTLTQLGLRSSRSDTQVLDLHQGYDPAFNGYSSDLRRRIRRARNEGIQVRDASRNEDVHAYYALHSQLVGMRGDYAFVYPEQLFVNLLPLQPHVRIIMAEFQGCVVAGGVFFFDGDSVMYWHSAANRDFSSLLPVAVVLDEAIRWACESGARFVNFGASPNEGVEKFKASWGAERRQSWHFLWRNPAARLVSGLRGGLAVRGDRRSHRASAGAV